MSEVTYAYCPVCGGRLKTQERGGRNLQICAQCGRTLYQNQRLTVSAAIIRDHKLLVVRRGIEPFMGMLDLPGGFVEADETAREGIIRELAEELHLKEARIVGVYDVLGPDLYPFEGVTYHNADMIYRVEIGSEVPRADDDVAEVIWVPLKSLPPESEFAFRSHKQFIALLKKEV